LAVDKALETEPGIEPVFAGTTACVALLRGDVLTCANAGDSRAVVAQRHPTKYTLSSTDLTVDKNPDLPEEMKRIYAAAIKKWLPSPFREVNYDPETAEIVRLDHVDVK
jgi:serine/threonine protein phosphatase PrpC